MAEDEAWPLPFEPERPDGTCGRRGRRYLQRDLTTLRMETPDYVTRLWDPTLGPVEISLEEIDSVWPQRLWTSSMTTRLCPRLSAAA